MLEINLVFPLFRVRLFSFCARSLIGVVGSACAVQVGFLFAYTRSEELAVERLLEA